MAKNYVETYSSSNAAALYPEESESSESIVHSFYLFFCNVRMKFPLMQIYYDTIVV